MQVGCCYAYKPISVGMASPVLETCSFMYVSNLLANFPFRVRTIVHGVNHSAQKFISMRYMYAQAPSLVSIALPVSEILLLFVFLQCLSGACPKDVTLLFAYVVV